MLEVAERTDAERAQTIRLRLRNPPNAKRDTGLALRHPHGVTGWEREKIIQATAVKALEKAKQDVLLKQMELISSAPKPLVRDWLYVQTQKPPAPPNLYTHIIKKVAKKFTVSFNDLISHRRLKPLVIPRHIAIYLGKELTPLSYPALGRRMGRRDHSSAIHAVRATIERMKADADLCQTVVELRAELEWEIDQWRREE